MKVEVRLWIDGVEMDLAPRAAELIERLMDPKLKASWGERIKVAADALRG